MIPYALILAAGIVLGSFLDSLAHLIWQGGAFLCPASKKAHLGLKHGRVASRKAEPKSWVPGNRENTRGALR